MNKEILRLAIPNIISNISIPLLSSVDTILMGHLSAVELGAVGIGSMIFNFVYWNFGFLRMGTTGMTAQAYGRKDQHEISALLQRSLLLSFVIAALIMLLMLPIAQASSYLMNVPADQQSFVNDYFFTRIWAAPASLGLYALLGWYFGMQNAKIPLLITVVINLTNIILSYYLVKIQGYGIRGVALGTVIAQYLGFFLALFIIAWQYRIYVERIPLKLLIAKEKIGRFLNINRDIFLRTICLTFAFAFLYSQAALEGELFLAANVILLQFMNWMSYAIDGFAYAAESLVGKFHGASDERNTKKSIRYLFSWGLGFAILFTIVFWGLGDHIIRLFSNQADVIEKTKSMIVWVILLPIVSFACYIWDGIFIGLTASQSMRNAMVISILIYLGSYFGMEYFFGIKDIWLAMLIFMGARGLIQTLFYAKHGLALK
ncbi:MATE family efflux transporter [Portibacter lacus]|uniref:MATE family efflux transporter n=1 Tax=Portibacter lacus TaxID=1099794 RepID=A0AA37SQG5_9BACT|nr:MATE family efflux transporter [Portibacter lacus]GLR16728.1 MATE family efflux transporter [Portibacter lacus]